MSDETQDPTPQQEPSVLDYLKSLFRFGKGERIQLPDFVEAEQPLAVSGQQLAINDPSVETQPATFQHSNIPFQN